jgi:hypothetical protein
MLEPMTQMDKPLPALGKYILGVAIELDTMNTGDVPAIDPKTATEQQAHDLRARQAGPTLAGAVQSLRPSRYPDATSPISGTVRSAGEAPRYGDLPSVVALSIAPGVRRALIDLSLQRCVRT